LQGHEAAVAFNIDSENSRKLAFEILCSPAITPLNRKASRRIQIPTGGPTLATFWRPETMTPMIQSPELTLKSYQYHNNLICGLSAH
jgi:hypothetical protein